MQGLLSLFEKLVTEGFWWRSGAWYLVTFPFSSRRIFSSRFWLYFQAGLARQEARVGAFEAALVIFTLSHLHQLTCSEIIYVTLFGWETLSPSSRLSVSVVHMKRFFQPFPPPPPPRLV